MNIQEKAYKFYLENDFSAINKEAWKYTNLPKIELLEKTVTEFNNDEITVEKLLGDHYLLVIIDGKPSLGNSILPENITILFDHEAIIKNFKEAHIALNVAKVTGAISILLDEEFMVLDKKLEIHHIVSKEAANYTQINIELARSAKLELIERFYNIANEESFSSIVVQAKLAKNASLEHYRLQYNSLENTHLYDIDLQLQDSSNYRSFSHYQGSKLSRQSVVANIQGEGVYVSEDGLIIGKGKQYFDSYLPVYHNSGGSSVNQHFRQLLDDEAKGVFYGSILIPKGSDKSEAHQLNKNLLLGEKSQSYSRPELDVLTDDIVCSHGSTTGNLDEQALYYLQTRGLDLKAAKEILTKSFIQEMVDSIIDIEVRDFVESLISAEK